MHVTFNALLFLLFLLLFLNRFVRGSSNVPGTNKEGGGEGQRRKEGRKEGRIVQSSVRVVGGILIFLKRTASFAIFCNTNHQSPIIHHHTI